MAKPPWPLTKANGFILVWGYLSSPPQIPRFPEVVLERRGLIICSGYYPTANGHRNSEKCARSGAARSGCAAKRLWPLPLAKGNGFS